MHQLRALRVWAGKPGLKAITCAGRELIGTLAWSLPSSTLYDALNPNRTTMPLLRIVEAMVLACRADVGEWVAAWREIALREQEAQNPWLYADHDSREPGDAARSARLTVISGEAAAGTSEHSRAQPEVTPIAPRIAR